MHHFTSNHVCLMCLSVSRYENVELGTTATLNCTSRKVAWHDMIFVIWKIHLHDKECMIAVAKNDSDHDTCKDGKKQIHIEDGTYHLIIPNFSVQDEGNYTCDISYQSGGAVELIKVSAWGKGLVTLLYTEHIKHTAVMVSLFTDTVQCFCIKWSYIRLYSIL